MSRPGSHPAREEIRSQLRCFQSDVVDRVRRAGGVWKLPKGEIRLPEVFGFCRGVERALALLQQAVEKGPPQGGRLILLGEIIHNPYVNDFFRRRGVELLTREQWSHLDEIVRPTDTAVVPAFGVPLPVRERLEAIGCGVEDCTCGDVRALWAWAERAARAGFGVVIYGRSNHDETLVTKSRLDSAGGRYVVVGNLGEVDRFCRAMTDASQWAHLTASLPPGATNARGPGDFDRLAQVSQTTMLYDETMEVRRRITEAFERRFGHEDAADRLTFQPTVCRATQRRQQAAMELTRGGCDLVIVVGGFGSSNTRHLYELARQAGDAWFIEGAPGILSRWALLAYDPDHQAERKATHWLPDRDYVRIGVLAGASCPETVVGDVLERLAEFLA